MPASRGRTAILACLGIGALVAGIWVGAGSAPGDRPGGAPQGGQDLTVAVPTAAIPMAAVPTAVGPFPTTLWGTGVNLSGTDAGESGASCDAG